MYNVFVVIFFSICHITMVCMDVLICDPVPDMETVFEPYHEKTNILHMRKQRRRSAWQLPRS